MAAGKTRDGVMAARADSFSPEYILAHGGRQVAVIRHGGGLNVARVIESSVGRFGDLYVFESPTSTWLFTPPTAEETA